MSWHHLVLVALKGAVLVGSTSRMLNVLPSQRPTEGIAPVSPTTRAVTGDFAEEASSGEEAIAWFDHAELVTSGFIEVPDRGFIIELHEPDDNPSTCREFLDQHGNGLHHLGFQVGERRDAVVAELEATGLTVRTFGEYPGGSWTIIDTKDSLGFNLNIKPPLRPCSRWVTTLI